MEQGSRGAPGAWRTWRSHPLAACLALLVSAPSAASADVVGPHSCPPGAVAGTFHHGRYCRPWVCTSDDDCGGIILSAPVGTTFSCRALPTCQAEVEMETRDRAGQPVEGSVRVAYGPCESEGARCARGSCVPGRVCVADSSGLGAGPRGGACGACRATGGKPSGAWSVLPVLVGLLVVTSRSR